MESEVIAVILHKENTGRISTMEFEMHLSSM